MKVLERGIVRFESAGLPREHQQLEVPIEPPRGHRSRFERRRVRQQGESHPPVQPIKDRLNPFERRRIHFRSADQMRLHAAGPGEQRHQQADRAGGVGGGVCGGAAVVVGCGGIGAGWVVRGGGAAD